MSFDEKNKKRWQENTWSSSTEGLVGASIDRKVNDCLQPKCWCLDREESKWFCLSEIPMLRSVGMWKIIFSWNVDA